MARKPNPQAMRERAAKTAAVMATPGGAVAAPKKTGFIEGLRNLPKFAMEVRAEARKNKNFATADGIRKGLAEIGVVLEDRPDGTSWSVTK